jgi:DNA-binding NarL/FixJ family response regulator
VKKNRVLPADDHVVMREGLRALLTVGTACTVVGEAENGRTAVNLVARLRPDVVVMDVAMPGLNGFQAARRIRQVAPETRVPALSAHSDDHYVAQMIRVGAPGFVAKQETGRVLPRANLRVAAGGTYFSPLIERRLRRLRALARTRGALAEVVAPEPTPRDAEVLQRIAEGSADKLIAAALGVSIKTVGNRRQSAMDELDIHDTVGLTRFALATGMIETRCRGREAAAG